MCVCTKGLSIQRSLSVSPDKTLLCVRSENLNYAGKRHRLQRAVAGL